MKSKTFSITTFNKENEVKEVLLAEYKTNELSFFNKRLMHLSDQYPEIVITLSPLKRAVVTAKGDHLSITVDEGKIEDRITTTFKVAKNPTTETLMTFTKVGEKNVFFKELEEKLF